MTVAEFSTQPDATAASADRRSADAAIAAVEEQFSIMYLHVKNKMRDRAAQIHPELQVVGYRVLTTLARSGPTHAGVLAETLGMDKSIISRQARLLEDLGLLKRECDPADRRATFLCATPAGSERVAEVHLSERAVLYEQLRDWELGDLEKLGQLIAKLNRR